MKSRRIYLNATVAALIFLSFAFESVGSFGAENAPAKSISEQLNADAAKIEKLANFLRNERFPYRFLNVETVLGDKSSVAIKDGKVSLPVLIKLSVNVKEFYEFTEKIEPFVNDLKIQKTRQKQQCALVDRSPAKNAFSVPLGSPSFDKRFAYICLPASKKASKFETIYWDIYAVPIKTATLLRQYARIVPVAKLSFKDKNGKVVAIKTTRTCQRYEQFAPPNGSRYLLAACCYDLNGSFSSGLLNFYIKNATESKTLPQGSIYGEKTLLFSFLPVILASRADGIGDRFNLILKETRYVDQFVFDLDDYEKIVGVDCRILEKNSALDRFYEKIDERLEETTDFYRE